MLKEKVEIQANGEDSEAKGIDFYPEYNNPTPEDFPIIGNMLSHRDYFNVSVQVAQSIQDNKDLPVSNPSHPEEPENPADLDDRQNILNIVALGCNLASKQLAMDSKDAKNINDNLFTAKGENGYQNESYLRHPIISDRTRSPFWYYLRRINNEIKRFQDIFLSTEVKGVYHTGLLALAQYASERYSDSTSRVPKYAFHGFEPEITNPVEPMVPSAEVWGLKPLVSDSISFLESIESPEGGLGVVVSRMVTAKGGEYILIVNHDAATAQNITLNFNKGYYLNELTPQSSEEGRVARFINTGVTTSLDRMLGPGGYLIFRHL